MKPNASAGASDGAKCFVDNVVCLGENLQTYSTALHILLEIEDLCKFDKLNTFSTGQETWHKID